MIKRILKSKTQGNRLTRSSSIFVTIADENYLLYAIFLCHQLNSYDENVKTMIVYSSKQPISSTQLNLIDGVLNLEVITIDPSEYFQKDLGKGHVSQSTFLKFWLTDLIPKKWERIVYFDPDILILRNPIEKLDSFELQHSFGAVEIPFNEKHLGYEPKNYFNAGFLLIDRSGFDFCLAKTYFSQLLDFENLKYMDQDVLNICYQEKFDSVSGTMNTFPYPRMNYKSSPIPHVIHFVGRNKPWKHSYSTIYHLLWIAKFNRFLKENSHETQVIRIDMTDIRHALIALLVRFRIGRTLVYLLKR
jgi:lipopolysaccharide biosynthesis glycosyltransferase